MSCHTNRKMLLIVTLCGGTGIDSTVPTNTVQVPITTGTVADSGKVYRYWSIRGVKWIYIQDK